MCVFIKKHYLFWKTCCPEQNSLVNSCPSIHAHDIYKLKTKNLVTYKPFDALIGKKCGQSSVQPGSSRVSSECSKHGLIYVLYFNIHSPTLLDSSAFYFLKVHKLQLSVLQYFLFNNLYFYIVRVCVYWINWFFRRLQVSPLRPLSFLLPTSSREVLPW